MQSGEMERIVCGVDHSEPSLRAAGLARELACKCGLELTLLHVVRLPEGRQDGIAEYLRHERSPEPANVVVLEAAQDELACLRDRLASKGGAAIDCIVRGGEPAADIVASARELGADLIVIGHRGQGRLAQALLGSVARRVIETAPCPVLVVR